jgi:hypothetical protein
VRFPCPISFLPQLQRPSAMTIGGRDSPRNCGMGCATIPTISGKHRQQWRAYPVVTRPTQWVPISIGGAGRPRRQPAWPEKFAFSRKREKPAADMFASASNSHAAFCRNAEKLVHNLGVIKTTCSKLTALIVLATASNHIRIVVATSLGGPVQVRFGHRNYTNPLPQLYKSAAAITQLYRRDYIH